MRSSIDIALVGATGLLGEQLLGVLAECGIPIGRLRPYGSAQRSPRVDSVTFKGESVPVQPLRSLAEDDSGLMFLCVSPAAAGKLGPALSRRSGRVLVDVGDAAGLDAPLVVRGAEAALADLGAVDGVRVPAGAAWMVGNLVAPRVGRGLSGVSGTVMQAASSAGRAGVAELGEQVIASFNQQDPPRRVFPTGLAFDALPEDGAMDEWSEGEVRVADSITAVTGFPADKVGVQIGTFPLFAGMTAALHLRGVTLEETMDALRGEPSLREVERAEKLRPRAWTGRTSVGWGRLRADRGGDGVHLWAVADPVAGVAALAGAVGRALWNGGGLLKSSQREEEDE